MAGPLSIRLDDRLRRDLEQEASFQGIPLSNLVRDILSAGARAAKRQRIHQDSARVAHYAAETPERQALFEETGGAHSNGF
ncbi:MAG: hypothetical protein ABF979_14200 [Gluconobacter sp.]|uniref:hypothetical protein n=1 Tax=Gluconobacter sp. TaxID=1876758 RepID=UPI0039EB963A